MIPIRYTRNLFLRAMCVVYLFAFISFYIQIPGLYGDNGIMPARSVLENSKHKTFSAKAHYQPTLLWLAPYLGLDTSYALDVLALLGTFLAFTGFISQKFCTIPLFAGLWSLYFSLYQIGQVFVTWQWDNLLLEAGFLSLLVAPLLPGKRRGSKGSPKDHISLWLVKWLFFRFFLSVGLSKLLCECPKWWNLTGLSYYLETATIPTPVSWYAYHLPLWVIKLATMLTYTVQIVIPMLFFVPIRNVRISAFVIQVFFQIFMFLTANMNFLSILLTTLLISTLDDQFFFGKSNKNNNDNNSKWMKILSVIATIAIFAAIIALLVVLFKLNFTGTEIQSSMGFTKDQFHQFLRIALLYGMYVAFASLGLTIVKALASAAFDSYGFTQKFFTVLQTAVYGLIALVLFVGSTVPVAEFDSATNSSVVPNVRNIYNRLHKLQIINSYGLYKRISSIDGRFEIILEGANNIDGPWLEYNFLYKPGNVNSSMPFVAPYSPRLDWQIWLAAQSIYSKEPWLQSLAHRLLTGKPEVLALLDKHHLPFNKPPKFIRGVLYKYRYSSWEQRWQQTWWVRRRIEEYMPIFTKDSTALIDTLKARNLLPNPIKADVHPLWQQSLDSIRYVTSRLEATLLMWSIFTAGCAIITTTTK